MFNHRKGLKFVRKFLRIAALYHDIGKTIQKDRHPTVGYYYVTLVEQGEKNHEETDKLKVLLGETDFRVLCDIIRYHDLFGVVGTGEASASVLIDSLPFRASSVEEQLILLSLLLLTNLADIAGTIPLTAKKAGQLTSDWSRLAAFIRESKGDKQQFAYNLIKSDQNSTFAIDRIQRLLVGWPPMPSEIPEDKQEALSEWIDEFSSPAKIEDALRVTIGTQFYEFCSDFALVCKLDYALRFFHSLEVYAFNEGLSPEDAIEITSALVKTLVQSYSNLTKRYDGSRRRIGIQVSGWTKTPEIRDSLIKLLFSRNRELGLGWASEEASAWYFE